MYVVVTFIVLMTSLCIYGKKQEKKEKLDAKNIRLEIQRRKLEQEERDAVLRKRKRE